MKLVVFLVDLETARRTPAIIPRLKDPEAENILRKLLAQIIMKENGNKYYLCMNGMGWTIGATLGAFLLVAGLLQLSFDNMLMVRVMQHWNLQLNCLLIKLSKFPPIT